MKKNFISHLPGQLELEQRIEQNAGIITFYGNIVVVEFSEGFTVSYSTAFSMLLKGLSILRMRPWIYISHRKHSYAVNPNDYKYLNKVPTLKGLIVLRAEEMSNPMEDLEEKFCKKPFFVVNTMEEAVKIANELLGAKKKLNSTK